MPNYKRMSSGKYIDMSDFQLEDVSVSDISNSLNHVYRFTGHHKDKKPLTVAQHTWLCMEISKMMFPGEPAVEFGCLLHDMPEAYYGDVATPFKKMLGDNYRKITDAFDNTVYAILWKDKFTYDEDVENKVKICDRISLDIERRNLWKSQIGKDLWPEPPKFGMSLNEKEEWFDKAQAISFVDLEQLWKDF